MFRHVPQNQTTKTKNPMTTPHQNLGDVFPTFPLNRRAIHIASVLSLLCFGNSLFAANSTWNGGSSSDSDWSDTANWGGTAVASGNNLKFAGTARQNNTNDLTSGFSIGNITNTTANWIINGNQVTVNGTIFNNAVAGSNTWGINTIINGARLTVVQGASGDILNISGALSGTGAFQNNAGSTGQGVVYLSNTTNSFIGNFDALSGGTVYYYSLAPGGQNCSLGAGTLIQLGQSGANFPPTLTYLGTSNGVTDRTLDFGNFTTGTINLNNDSPNNSSLTFNGPMVSLGDGTVGDVYTIALGGTSAATNTFTGIWNASGPTNVNLQITNGPGTWVFTNLNYLTGNLAIYNNGRMVLGYNSAFPSSTILFPTISVYSGGFLDLSSYDQNSSVFVLGEYPGYPETLIAGRTNGAPAVDINGSLSLDGVTGTTLNIAGQGVPGTLTVSSNLIAGSATLMYDLSTNTAAGGGSNDLIVVSNNLDLSQGIADVVVDAFKGSLTTNVPYTLIHYGGSLIGSASGLDVLSPGRTYSPSLSTATPGLVTVTFNPSGVTNANLVWKGNVNQNWDVDTTANWLNNGNNDYFYNGDNVTFNDSASQFGVNLAAAVQPSAVTVSNSANNYTFSSSGGIISGGSLTKQGTAQLAIAEGNSYSGNTVISAGTIEVENPTALSSSSVILGDANSGANPVSLLFGAGAGSVANAITVSANGTGMETIGYADGTSGTITLNGPISLQHTLNIYTANPTTAISLLMQGGITGTGDVWVIGGGSVKWQTGACTFSGNIYVTNSGSYLDINASISTNDNIYVSSNTILGEVFYPPFNALNGGGSVEPGYNAASDGSLQFGTANGSGTFSGNFTTNSGGYYCNLVKAGTGTEIFTGDNSVSPGSTTISAGVLVVNNSAGSGLGYGGVTVSANGTLAGKGSVYSSVATVSVSGQLSVGNAGDSSGASLTLTNAGGLTINSGGALDVSLFSGAGAGNNTGNAAAADLLNAQCPVTLNSGSVLNVVNPNGMTAWAVGDEWKIANWNSQPAGIFTVLNLPTLPGTMMWSTNALYTSGVLSIVTNTPSLPTQPATITGVTLSGGNLIIIGTNLNGGQSFHYAVLSSTNLLLPLTNWTALSTNVFNANGTFNYTNAIVPTNPAMFFDTKAVQ
jgi:autotransporter-associated beta strand protein